MSENSQSNPENPNASPEVAAIAAPPSVSHAAAINAAAGHGLAVVGPKTIGALAEIGVKANTYGLTKIASGGLICTMEGLSEMQDVVLTLAKSTHSDKTKLAAALAFAGLAKAMHGCATAVNADGLAAQDKKSNKPRRALATSSVTVSTAQP